MLISEAVVQVTRLCSCSGFAWKFISSTGRGASIDDKTHGEKAVTPVTVTVTGSKIKLNFLALSKDVVLSSSATLRIENR